MMNGQQRESPGLSQLSMQKGIMMQHTLPASNHSKNVLNWLVHELQLHLHAVHIQLQVRQLGCLLRQLLQQPALLVSHLHQVPCQRSCVLDALGVQVHVSSAAVGGTRGFGCRTAGAAAGRLPGHELVHGWPQLSQQLHAVLQLPLQGLQVRLLRIVPDGGPVQQRHVRQGAAAGGLQLADVVFVLCLRSSIGAHKHTSKRELVGGAHTPRKT